MVKPPLSGLSDALKNQDRDTVIFGILIISVFTAMIFGVPPTKATVAGCLFLGLYVVARYVLMRIRVRELQLALRADVGGDAAKLVKKYASDLEQATLAQISSQPKRRGGSRSKTGD